jgi:hypothetical protein
VLPGAPVPDGHTIRQLQEQGLQGTGHMPVTNIVESPFSAVRLRTDASRRFKKTDNAEAMIWKLLTVAEQSWRKLNAPELMQDVYHGTRFKDGIAVQTKPNRQGKPPESFYTPIDKTSTLYAKHADH